MKRFLFAWKKNKSDYQKMLPYPVLEKKEADRAFNESGGFIKYPYPTGKRHGGFYFISNFTVLMILSSLLFFFALPNMFSRAYAVDDTCVAAATGDWTGAGTWTSCNDAGTGYPDSDDTVTIGASYTITVSNASAVNAQAGSINCTLAAAGTCTIVVESNVSLTVTNGILLDRGNFNTALNLSGAGTVSAASITIGNAAVNPTADRTNILTTTIANLNISGNVDINSYEGTANTAENLARLFLYGGTMDVDGIINVNSDGAAAAYSQFLLSGATSAPTLNIAGSGAAIDVDTGSTFTPAATSYVSIVNYDGADQTVRAATYDSLTLSGSGTKTMTSVATITNNLSVEGSASATSGSNMTIGGTLNIGSSASFTFGGTNTYAVTGATTVDGTLNLSTSGATQTLTGLVTINGLLDITNGTVTKTFSSGIDINSGGTFDNDNNNAAITTDTTFENDGTFYSGTGTYTFNAATTISGGSPITFDGNVAITGTVTVQNSNTSTVTVNGNLTGSATGSTWRQNDGSTADFFGAVLVTGALNAGTASNTVYYSGSNATACKGGTYYNLEYQRSSACAVSANTTINNDLNITDANGSFEIGAFTSTVTGDTVVNGTLRITSTTGTKTFGDLTIANGANMEFTVAEGITMNGDLTINGTGVIDGAATSGTWLFQKPIGETTGLIGGTMSTPETIGPVTITTAYTIDLALNIAGALTYTNAYATNSATLTTTGAVTGNSGTSYFFNNDTLDIGNGLTGTNGTIIQGENAVLNIAGTHSITNRDFSANGNTVTFDGTAAQTIPATTYHHLNIHPAATVTETLSAGTYTINGNLDIGNGTNTTTVQATTSDPNISVAGNFTVNSGATFTGHNSAGHSLDIDGNLLINGAFTAPTIAADPFTIGGNFTNNGTFNAGTTSTITFDDNSKSSTLTYSANTTFRNFTVNTQDKHLIFDAFERTIIAGSLNIDTNPDDCGHMIILTSEVPGNQFDIDAQGIKNIQYANITDSNAITPITATNSKGYNYAGWTFGSTICGSLSLSAPASSSLSTVQLAFPRPNATGSLGTTTATDTRGTNVGWSLIATCTDFIDGGNTIEVTNLTIEPDNSTLDAVIGTLTGVAAGVQHTFSGTSDPANIITASFGEGTGQYVINPDLSLSIPVGAYAGNYTATMTLTLN